MQRKLILIFIDGIGIGENNKNNPFFLEKSLYFSHFKNEFKNGIKIFKKNNFIVFSLNPSLDINGIPQSATGQSSIFTGINTAKILNQHLTGFPNRELRRIVMKNNLLLKLKQRGLRVKFINSYPLFADELSKGYLKIDSSGYFILKNKNNESLTKFLKKISVTTLLALSIKQKFYGLSDLINKRTIYHDFTNNFLISKGINIPQFTPDIAGEILVKNLTYYDVILYEYFLTDKIGHKPSTDNAITTVKNLDKFVNSIINLVNLKKTDIFIFSDHGNFEDLSIRTHTKNNVPFIHIGESINFRHKINNITDIYKYILNLKQ